MKFEEIIRHKEILEYYRRGSAILDALGYTDHSVAHTKLVAERAADILKAFEYGQDVIELAKIAGFMHDFAMTDAFVKAAEAKGHTVTRFDTSFMKIGFCHACETCYKKGKACSFDDEFNTIAPVILDADAVVFSMPVYWYSIPTQIKGVIDRLFSFVVGGKDYAGKECALITCCEEEDMSVMDGVRIPMERTAALLQWNMVGEVLVPGVLEAGAIEKTDGCAQAAALAEKM